MQKTLKIDTQYADDCGNAIATKDKRAAEYMKSTIPGILRSRNLYAMQTKQKQHIVKHNNRYGTWSKCKYLGSKLRKIGKTVLC